MPIPTKWKEYPNKEECKPTPMLGNWLGEVFAIGYTLGVYVKFDVGKSMALAIKLIFQLGSLMSPA